MSYEGHRLVASGVWQNPVPRGMENEPACAVMAPSANSAVRFVGGCGGCSSGAAVHVQSLAGQNGGLALQFSSHHASDTSELTEAQMSSAAAARRSVSANRQRREGI